MSEVITRLSPPIPLNTAKGPGFAHFMISYGAENDLYWVIFRDDGKGIWHVPNRKVRPVKNWSFDRPSVDYPELEDVPRPKPRKKKSC
jgi:hypothetical protein